MFGPQPLARAFEVASHATLLVVLGLMLVAAGQPLFTDDLWWHLALGQAYTQEGPWLAADPLLFTALGPPAPAAWLSDVTLAAVESALGLTGLRVVHVLLIAGILGVVWWLLRRVGASAWGASAGTAVFAAMAAYRLVQLRPHLATILATLILYRLVLEGTERPTRARMAAAIALLGLWPNLHGGFLMGPVLLFTAALAGFVQAAASSGDRRSLARRRGLAILVTALLGLVATGLNPSGFDQHAAFFLAGSETPALSMVLDEWAPIDPFAWPVPDIPPSPFTWLLFWGLCVATSLLAIRILRRLASRDSLQPAADLTLVALALGSLASMMFAVRFTWMCVFPLLLIASAARAGAPVLARSVATRLAALAVLPGFVFYGAWPMVSRGVPVDGFVERYRIAYPPEKYHANAVWFMADAGLVGNLFNEYFCGGFLGFWLAPQLRTFVNGTLNVPPAAIEASRAIREGHGQEADESFLALLDRYEIDAFMGVGEPALPRGSRPVWYSTALLEGAPGWLPVFRGQRSAVYLRVNDRNRANLERVTSYYARNRVPFDPERGFEPSRVIEAALPWAVSTGVVPFTFTALQAVARGRDRTQRAGAQAKLSQTYGMLGLYEHALRLDRRMLKRRPENSAARSRIVWALLRLGRAGEALQVAEALGPNRLDRLLRATAEALVSDPKDKIANALVPRLPILWPAEANSLARATMQPEVRLAR